MIGTHFHHSAIYARALLQTPRLRAPRQGKTEEVRQRYISRVGLGARELFRTGLGAREPCRELFRTGLGVGAEARIAPTEACMADSCARSASHVAESSPTSACCAAACAACCAAACCAALP